MKVVILGAGRRGIRLARHLVEENKDVIIIDEDAEDVNTAMAKVFDVNTASSVDLDGKADSDVLQRVHGLAFPSKAQLKEWEAMLEEARRRES